jgi:esterase/lipase superfamily enzyme
MRLAQLSLQCALLLLTCSSAWASDCAASKYVSVPVLYLTDRAASPKGFGSQRKTEVGTAIYNLNFGKLNCSVKNSLGKKLVDKQKQLEWVESNKKDHLTITPLPGSGTDNSYQELGKAVSQAALKSDSKEVFVIIHGYNTTFASAAKSAAQLAYSVERPVVVFDWPSKGKVFQYEVDSGNNEWSQEHFDRLLEEMKALKDRTGIKLNLLAHSMGNRLAIRSAPVLKGQHLFDHIYLVDPDFDAETFVHYLIRYARSNNLADNSTTGGDNADPTKVQILFSHRDRALPLAQCLFGGYTRLGQAADLMLSTVFNPLSVTEGFGIQKNDLPADAAVSTAATATTAASDAAAKSASELLSRWSMKFEWIDFTVLDHGVIGHTIPFQLIANLWSGNDAGEGLKLVDSPNNEPNPLSRLFLGLFHEKKHVSSRLGICKRVEKIENASSKLSTANALK